MWYVLTKRSCCLSLPQASELSYVLLPLCRCFLQGRDHVVRPHIEQQLLRLPQVPQSPHVLLPFCTLQGRDHGVRPHIGELLRLPQVSDSPHVLLPLCTLQGQDHVVRLHTKSLDCLVFCCYCALCRVVTMWCVPT
jgi:hypothetical protein